MSKREAEVPPPKPAPAPQTSLDQAWAAYASQDYPRAEELLNGLREQAPRDIETAYLAGLVGHAQGDTDRARAGFQAVVDYHAEVADRTRARMLRRLAVGHLNQLAVGAWNLEPETWERT